MTPDGSSFSLVFSRALGKVIVHVNGALDVDTGAQLRDRLVDLMDRQGNRDVVLDLRATTRIDGAGLSVLGCALRRIQRRGGGLVLSGPTAGVARVLEAEGLHEVLLITPAWQHPVHGRGRAELGIPGWGRRG